MIMKSKALLTSKMSKMWAEDSFYFEDKSLDMSKMHGDDTMQDKFVDKINLFFLRIIFEDLFLKVKHVKYEDIIEALSAFRTKKDRPIADMFFEADLLFME